MTLAQETREEEVLSSKWTSLSYLLLFRQRDETITKLLLVLLLTEKCLHNYVFLAIVSLIPSFLFFSYRPSSPSPTSLNMIITAPSGTCVSVTLLCIDGCIPASDLYNYSPTSFSFPFPVSLSSVSVSVSLALIRAVCVTNISFMLNEDHGREEGNIKKDKEDKSLPMDTVFMCNRQKDQVSSFCCRETRFHFNSLETR